MTNNAPSDASVPDCFGDFPSMRLDDSINDVSVLKTHIAFLSRIIQSQKEELERLRLQKTKNKEEISDKNRILLGNQKIPKDGHPSGDVHQLRNQPVVWKSSGSRIALSNNPHMVDVLNCKPLISGVVTWKIHVHREDGMRLGLISPFDHVSFDQDLGHQNSTWGYGSLGDAWHGGTRVGGHFPTYHSGSIIEFVLDLSAEGTLDVSVSGLPLIRVFSDMKVSTNGRGFVPAAHIYKSSNIEFLGFRTIA